MRFIFITAILTGLAPLIIIRLLNNDIDAIETTKKIANIGLFSVMSLLLLNCFLMFLAQYRLKKAKKHIENKIKEEKNKGNTEE